MAIARSIPKSMSGATLLQTGLNAPGIVHNAASAHHVSMLSQAARVPRLANISTVSAMLGKARPAGRK